jgi:O-antigen/teichoic acid export membrane protein
MLKKILFASPTFWATTHSAFEQAFWIALFALQAPLLGPHAFGLITLAMVLVGFCEFVFVTVASEALISLNEIEDRHFDTMLTVTILASLVAGAAIFFGADYYGRLMKDAELARVLQWMAILPLVSAFCSAPTAAAQRRMQFRALAQRSIVSLIAGGSVGLALTLAGTGVWALVWQALVQRIVGAITLWLCVPLRPRLGISPRHFRDLRGFAAKMAASRIMNWVQAPLSRLILGFYLGTIDLGIFSLAARLNNVLVQVALGPRIAVARVAFRRFKADPSGLEPEARRLFLITSVCCFPLFIGGAAILPILFHLWLGPEWNGSVKPAQFMLLMGVPTVTFYCTTALLLSLNHQATEAFISTCQTISVVLVVAAAVPFGLTAVTAAIALRQLVMLPLPVILLHRQCKLSMQTILLTQLPALLASAAMGAAVLLLGPSLESRLGNATSMMLLLVGSVFFYGSLIALMLPGPAGRAAQQLTRLLHG